MTWARRAGVMYKTFSPEAEIMRCFRCHSTGPLELGDGLSIEPSETGVQCGLATDRAGNTSGELPPAR